MCVSVRYTVATLASMTAVIPNLFSLATITFTTVGVARPQQITMGLQPGVGLTPAQQNAALRGALIGAVNRPFSAANMDNQYSCVESKILYRNASGVLLSHIDTGIVVGTKVIDPLPLNTSVILRKVTSFAGKKYRGRCLLPPMFFNEADVDNAGNISAVATYQTIWDNAYASLVAGAVPPVLLHDDPALTPTAINSFSVNTRIGTIGKRLRP